MNGLCWTLLFLLFTCVCVCQDTMQVIVTEAAASDLLQTQYLKFLGKKN